MTERKTEIEIVVKAGAEGGSLTLFRQSTPGGGYEYFTNLNAMGFEDVPGVHEQSGRVKTLDEGFALLDAARGCEWHRLYAVEVHPDHAAAVLGAVKERLSQARSDDGNERVLEEWQRKCGLGLLE